MEADLAILDELQAEYETFLEQADHGDECFCSECVDERHADEDELRQQRHDYERLVG